MTAIAFTISYNGSSFSGYQYQPGERTVQGLLEQALSTYFRIPVTLDVCGRTDSGVHATGQVVAARCNSNENEQRVRTKLLANTHKFLRSIHALCKRDVIITRIHSVPSNFHPRFHCVAREYEYLVSEQPSPPQTLSCVWTPGQKGVPVVYDVEKLNQISSDLVGHFDFQTFTRTEHSEDVTYRYIDLASWSRKPEAISGRTLLSFVIRGNAFLHNMIRIVVGTIIDIYRGHNPYNISQLIEAKDRRLAGPTTPPHGLYLRKCYYASELWAADSNLELLTGYPVFRPGFAPEKPIDHSSI